MMNNWYVVTPDGKEIMLPEDELLAGVSTGQYAAGTLIWREGLEAWEPIEKHFPEAFRKQTFSAQKLKSLFTKKRCFLGAIALLCMCFLLSLCGEKQTDSVQQEVAAAVKEIQWYVGKGDWAQFHDTFEELKDNEVYGSLYYSDGVRKEKPDELTEEQLNYRAWHSLWSSAHSSEQQPLGRIMSEIRNINRKLEYAHPSEADQLKAALAQLKDMRLANFIQLEASETMHMATFLANGDANESLTAVTAMVCQLSNAAPDNAELSFYARCLNDLRRSARLVSKAIPWECQLYIVDEYERKLKEHSQRLKLYQYESPQELVVLRNQLRKYIKRQMAKGTQQ